jgi:formamidopyrimidine-DNA glycosylase
MSTGLSPFAATAPIIRRERNVGVYRRSGRPCPRCGEPIRMRRQDEHARATH